MAEFRAEFGGRGSFRHRFSVLDAPKTSAVYFLPGFVVSIYGQYVIGKDGKWWALQYHFGIVFDPLCLVLCRPGLGFSEEQEENISYIVFDLSGSELLASNADAICCNDRSAFR